MKKLIPLFVILIISGFILSSPPVVAGGKIVDTVPALGLNLRENADLGRMPSVLFGEMNPNDQRTWLMCQNFDDANCTNAPEIFGPIELDICNANSVLSCIADAWAVDANGTKIQGTFVKSVPNDPRYNIEENPTVNLPASHGMGGLWRFPGVMNSAGKDTYFISSQQIAGMRKQAGVSIMSAGKLYAGSLMTGIFPVEEISGTFNLVTATDASKGGFAWGSNGTQYAPDNSVCAAADLTVCEAIRQFPKGYRFGVTLHLGQKVNGWFHGRFHLPTITTKDWKNGVEVSIEADPVDVPSLNFTVPNADIPAAAKKLVFSGIELGMEGDGRTATKIDESLSGPYTMDLISAFTDAYKNTATTTDSYWSFQTLNENSDKIGRCSSSASNLAGLVTTNALGYSAGPPTLDSATGSLAYKVASPHFQADGQPAVGTYDLSVRSEVARCIYGFSKAPIHAEVSIQSQDGNTQIATTTVSEKDGWLYLSAKGFGYSNPTIQVKLTQDKAVTPDPIATNAPVTSKVVAKQVTITCIKGKVSKKVSASKPVCPKGYVKK